MKTKEGWPVAVCSWSLKQDLAGVASSLKQIGVNHVHLAVGPAVGKGGEAYIEQAKAQGWVVTSAMTGFPQEDYSTLETIRRTGGIMPDAEWPSNRQQFTKAADVAASLGTQYLSMHAGFLDHGDSAGARKFHDRIRALADVAAGRKLVLLLETGQENAADLRRFLEEMKHPALGINFDPANMILYDKDNPVEAVRVLGPWIRHVHIKDAVRTKKRGEWGAEVPWGEGEVGEKAFLKALKDVGFTGALAIEREGGDNRLGDINLAVRRLME